MADTVRMKSIADVVIVGAGMAGLAAGQFLRFKKVAVSLLDKGRSLGGRMATRQENSLRYDYGAQFFTAYDPIFQQWVYDWEEQGVITRWPNPNDQSRQRFIGSVGVQGVARHMAEGLRVDLEVRVNQIAWDVGLGAWVLTDDSGHQWWARAVLLTPPVPQSLELLDQNSIAIPDHVREDLLRVSYYPCLTVMAQVEGPSKIPPAGLLFAHDEPEHLSGKVLSWMADNTKKGISPKSDDSAVTLHAQPEFSQTHYDDENYELVDKILDAAQPWVDRAMVRKAKLHRWRYSLVHQTAEGLYAELDTPGPLLFAGDGFVGPRVEGAAQSGLAAAQRLLKRLGGLDTNTTS